MFIKIKWKIFIDEFVDSFLKIIFQNVNFYPKLIKYEKIINNEYNFL